MTITARIVMNKGRIRLLASDGKFVQCPREWRETIRCGAAIEIEAKLRSDGECYVYYPN